MGATRALKVTRPAALTCGQIFKLVTQRGSVGRCAAAIRNSPLCSRASSLRNQNICFGTCQVSPSARITSLPAVIRTHYGCNPERIKNVGDGATAPCNREQEGLCALQRIPCEQVGDMLYLQDEYGIWSGKRSR